MSSIITDFKHYKKFMKITKKGTLLDLGCGKGKISSYLINMGYECIGYDNNEKVINEGKIIYPYLNLNVGDITCIPKQLNKATGAIYIYSLSFLTKEEILKSFISCNKNLINKGTILISTLCNDIINKQSLTYILNKAGFKTYYCKYRNKSKEVIHIIAKKIKNIQ